MTEHRNGLPLVMRWDARNPLPLRWVVPEGRPRRPASRTPLNICDALRRLCDDVTGRCELLRHIRMPSVLVSFTPSRNRSVYGLQARVTPLRFRDGRITRPHGRVEYQVQRYTVDGREMLYVLTFCLPRFLDQSFREKLTTVFHELYHMSAAFDGDLRRHPGRYEVHTHSKGCYDARMGELADEYLADHPDPAVFEFLRYGYADLWVRRGGLTGVVVPRPKLLPVGWVSRQAARDAV